MTFDRLVVSEVPHAESGGRQIWRLCAPLWFSSRTNGGHIEVHVPEGFTTDFASVPRLLWWLFPPTGPWCRAAVMHDYLYRRSSCSRFLADALFREAMAQLGVPTWRRVIMYYAVRLFGWLARPKKPELRVVAEDD